MTLDKENFSNYIKQFMFRELFNDMGWNNDTTTQPIEVDNQTYILEAVAEKSSFKILLCENDLIPNYNTRKKIETKVTKLFQEHLIIFVDKTEQIWQLVVRQSGKLIKIIEIFWHEKQDPQFLYQCVSGIQFDLDEEERGNITIIDVIRRVADNFHQNSEKVTKQFYTDFKTAHDNFLIHIKNISKENSKWYASLMLNRLMFCYFIQKKKFLDNNPNYLRDKLEECKHKKKKVNFYSFYRNFLLVLFHKGLNEPTQSDHLKIEIGTIPYLNGGLFNEHELEKTNASIEIDDKAFEELFDFFDQYEWHLDTRHTANGKDINPDVIGYIFEKYINDKANMGAYYTKEDITDYISKNCILPYLFDESKRHYPTAFNPDAELWQMVKQSGDQYIYNAVKKGVNLPLPSHIQDGIQDVSKRTEWNKSAKSTHALPTEIWREVVERRHRYTEVKNKIDRGEIQNINDFITYNLNIRQFAQDVVENTNTPELLEHFYKALNNVTIIDPTCGSGAFLFAAMNILEPLYESCLQRMENFVAEAYEGQYPFFEETLAQVKSPKHPNLQYFIYKSIILRNLYGVDIMKEAVEIAKLRLFLKLVATVDANYSKQNLGLEPLPDIDFNIRAGNTLVGFATREEVENAIGPKLDLDNVNNDIQKIKEKCDIIANTFKKYKEIQLIIGVDFKDLKKAKEDLNKHMKELNNELNELFHKQIPDLKDKDENWLQSHQPFHWFAEFYEVVQEKGGFDVIIGNPPYVEYSKVKNQYSIKNYDTESCGNLYAFVMEKMINLCHNDSYTSFIVPLAGVSTDRMLPLQNLLLSKNQYLVSIYIESTSNPSQLFSHVKVQLAIHNYKKGNNEAFKSYTTNYLRFYASERVHLFEKINLSINSLNSLNNRIPKISNSIELKILEKIKIPLRTLSSYYGSKYDCKIYYRRLGNFFFKLAFLNPPLYKVNNIEKLSSTVEITYIKDIPSEIFIGIINSSLTYWFWILFSNVMDFKLDLVSSLKFDYATMEETKIQSLRILCNNLLNDLEKNKEIGFENRKNGEKVEIGRYFPQKSKPIIDEIDTILAEYYGFTNEELDFIINYDIKYRMGKEADDKDEE